MVNEKSDPSAEKPTLEKYLDENNPKGKTIKLEPPTQSNTTKGNETNKINITEKQLTTTEKLALDLSEVNEVGEVKEDIKKTEFDIKKLNKCGTYIDRTPQIKDAISRKLGNDDWNSIKPRELRRIKKLVIENKEIESIKEKDLDGIINLKELSLKGNPLTEFPDSFFEYIPNLRKLNISNTKISTLKENFRENALKKLKILIIDSKQKNIEIEISKINSKIICITID